MCGRFTLTAPGDALAEAFDLAEAPALAPRWNVAPGQPVAAVRAGRPRTVEMLHWGFRAGARLLVNARAETAPARPAFREAFAARRCLILADGFYEWQAAAPPRAPAQPALPGFAHEPPRSSAAGGRQPWLFRRRDRAPFALAGLWEPREGEPALACTILTTAANATVARLHDRMPVILARDALALWLDASVADGDRIAPLLRPLADDTLAAHPVSPRVNDVRHDDAGCAAPV